MGQPGPTKGIFEMQTGSSAATRAAALLVGLLLFAPGPARAADFTLDVLQNGASIGSFDETDFSCQTLGANTENCQASGIALGALLLDSITLDIDPDPFIAGDFAITNNGANANFTFIFTATVAPIAINTLTSGSAAGGVSDGSGDGAFINTVNTGHSAFYAALIDNILYDTLDPVSDQRQQPHRGGLGGSPSQSAIRRPAYSRQ